MEIDGGLSVTGEINSNNQRILNVGTPLLNTDAVNAQFVEERTSNSGRIIILKCPWRLYGNWGDLSTGSCEPPECPNSWVEIATSNEITSVSFYSSNVHSAGNSIRFCMESEE